MKIISNSQKNSTLENLRIVVIDSPYDTIQSQLTRDLLGKIAALKITGYRAEYPYGVLPVDSGDFVGVHLLLCEQTKNGELNPIMGFKSVSYERCKIHHLPFPAFHLFPKQGCEPHLEAIQNIITKAEYASEKISYNGSWTVDQTLRSNKEMMKVCFNMTLMMLVRHYTDSNIKNVLAVGIKRFRVPQFKEEMGFQYLSSNGNRVPSFLCVPFFNEPAELMYLRNFSEDALATANKLQKHWDDRIIIAEKTEKVAA